MRTEVIQSRLNKLCDSPCNYNGKKVTIHHFEVNEEKQKVFIHIGKGLPEERGFDSMENFFKHCIPFVENEKSDVEILTAEGDDEEETEETFDIPPAPGLDEHILTDEDLNDFDEEGKRLPKTQKKSNAVALFTSPEEMKLTINDVKDILMGTIKKVQKDKDYIQQANAVNQSVNSLINLAKLSLQLMNKKQH